MTMLRNSKVHYKSSELYPILSMHFGKSMNLARIKAMSLVILFTKTVQGLQKNYGDAPSAVLLHIPEHVRSLFPVLLLALFFQ